MTIQKAGATPFTPGPWHVASGSVYVNRVPAGVEGICIAHMDRDEPATRPTERDANARLIAAAPSLYEALDALLALVRARQLSAPLDKEGAVDVGALTYADTVLTVAREAIRLVEGE